MNSLIYDYKRTQSMILIRKAKHVRLIIIGLVQHAVNV